MKRLLLALMFAVVSVSGQAGWGKPKKDIVDTAVDAGIFNTLVTAVAAADLVDTLKSEGPFTVFAPTDDAFAKLPDGTVEALLNDIPALTNILTYHVLGDKYSLRKLKRKGKVEALNGSMLEISKDDGEYFINSSLVIKKVKASNGVIYVIDSVLLP